MLVCNEVPLHVVREALVCGHAAGATTILNPAPATGIGRSIFGLADIVTPNRTELALLLQTEARRTGRKSDATTVDMAVKARSLLEAGPDGAGVRKAVIVTLGASGVVVVERADSGLDRVIASRAEAPEVAEVAAVVSGEPFDGVPVTAPAAAPTADIRPGADHAPTGALRVGEYRGWEVAADRVATVDSTGAGDAFCGALAAALAEGRPLVEAVERAVAAGGLATTHSGAREGMPTAAELEEYLAVRGAAVGSSPADPPETV
jgi:sugar/nucleoside kinase (ribokinase family)